MALNAAEKQRRYRQRRDANPEKKREHSLKEKLNYRKKKRAGKIKLIGELDRRDQKAQRAKWREYKQNERKKKKDEKEQLLSPPSSPLPEEIQESRQEQEGRRRRNRKLSKVYTDNNRLKCLLEQERRKVEMYRKRCLRAETKTRYVGSPSGDVGTPKTKTKRLINKSSKTIRKTLDFHHTLMDQIKEKYKKSKTKEKKVFSSLVMGRILRKYKFRTLSSNLIGCRSAKGCLPKERKVSNKLAVRVRQFYIRDDNSRITTGVKRTVTCRKVKMQKRLLSYSVKELHQKFLAENINNDISYTTFWRLRPFWVKRATESDRDTCLCKIHENFDSMLEVLHRLDVVNCFKTESFVNLAACQTNRKECMYGECQNCSDFRLELKGLNQNMDVTWKEWRSEKQSRDIKNVGEKQITIVKQNKEVGSLGDLIQKFYELVPKMKRHQFNVDHHLKHYQKVRSSLSKEECVIHIDFAENYTGKMHSEIQSMHFGASKPQITLHTGIMFTSSYQKTFTTVSDSLEHGPSAIWSHLHPILKDLRKHNPDIDFIHFFSDGPTAQYRQKVNFYLLSTRLHEYGFKGATWNFFETAHGKGAPDGVGGSLKRRADELVRCGSDIMNAETFVKELNERKTNVFLQVIPTEDQPVISVPLGKLQSVPGTMKLHQVITTTTGTIHYRDVSCTCSIESPCQGHQTDMFTFPSIQRKSSIEDTRDDSLPVPKQRKASATGEAFPDAERDHPPPDVPAASSAPDKTRAQPDEPAALSAPGDTHPLPVAPTSSSAPDDTRPLPDEPAASSAPDDTLPLCDTPTTSSDLDKIHQKPDKSTASSAPDDTHPPPDQPTSSWTLEDLRKLLPLPEELVDKYVLVLYDNRAYPGRVIDFDEEHEVYVSCMAHVSRKENCFFWPSVKDKCWYSYDTDLLAVIPEPRGHSTSRHREVDQIIWEIVSRHVKKMKQK